MDPIDLVIGEHIIEWRATDYAPLTCKIDVTETGIVCLSLPVCGKTTPPGVEIIGWTVTGHLKSLKEALTYFEWVLLKGGTAQIKATDVNEITDAFIGIEDIGFAVTVTNVNSTIDYFLGLG